MYLPTKPVQYIHILLGIILILGFSGCKSKAKSFDPHQIEGDQSQEKKRTTNVRPYQSTYPLDPIVVFGVPEDGIVPHVNLSLSLAYPLNDHDAEKEIILRRFQIRNYITEYLSLKRYSQLSNSNKREYVIKRELLEYINKNFMKEHPLMDLYFSKVSVLPVRK